MIHSVIWLIIALILIWIAIKITMKVVKIAIIVIAILFLIGTAKTFISNVNHNEINHSNNITVSQYAEQQ
ncbi:hypothetical protein [Clostridium massiliamazoniense]|uniref:hypothetical protein n=1 Tax=Clostridium massiliamazoniense TaxID=1347366 RepID=UPI0006D7F150|nr:hypothetical protein [Clostridium massiliamazoniense]